MRRGFLLCLIVLVDWISLAQQPANPNQGGPTIQIVEGDGAINSIRLHRGHDVAVRVVGPEGEPIPRAAVTFLLPATGPSANFGENGLSITVETDERGIAVGRGLRPNGVPGQFRIRVTTSWHDSPAVATVSQTNAEPATHSSRTKTIAILAVIAGAAAGGAAAALGHQSGSSSPGTTNTGLTPGGTIISGNPSIGPPH